MTGGGKKQSGLLNIQFNFLLQHDDREPNQTCEKNALLPKTAQTNKQKESEMEGDVLETTLRGKPEDVSKFCGLRGTWQQIGWKIKGK